MKKNWKCTKMAAIKFKQRKCKQMETIGSNSNRIWHNKWLEKGEISLEMLKKEVIPPKVWQIFSVNSQLILIFELKSTYNTINITQFQIKWQFYKFLL